MSKSMRLVLASAVMTAMIAALFAVAPAAGAKSEDVIARGKCTGGGRWRLELSTTAGGKIEVDYKVFSVAGQTWRVVARHNGAVYFRGSRGLARLSLAHRGGQVRARQGGNGPLQGPGYQCDVRPSLCRDGIDLAKVFGSKVREAFTGLPNFEAAARRSDLPTSRWALEDLNL